MEVGKAYIGTSGWNYQHWESTFYPSDLKKENQLNYFAKHFSTVELNNSFYRQPDKKKITKWNESTPADFIFAVKANRYFTHLKKLKVDAMEAFNFLKACDGLEGKLGPILFQLPPKWKINLDRLEKFLTFLPNQYRYTFEFREPSWYNEKVYGLLKKYNCGFCIYHLAGHQSPILTTADFVYIRLHGPGDKYQGNYIHESIVKWSKLCIGWLKEHKDVYVYFDNDQNAYAVQNAIELQKVLTFEFGQG